MKTCSIEELQNLYLPIIKEFDEFCKSHSLRYYVDGGTLLGAVRNHGFIPWDDDVDVVMPRPDYDRFIIEWSGTLRLYCYEQDKKCLFSYAKLFSAANPIVKVVGENCSSEVFVKIDIYPMDGVGNTSRNIAGHVRKITCLKRLFYLSNTQEFGKNPIHWLLIIISHILGGSKIFSQLDKTMRRYSFEDSEYVSRWRMPDLKRTIYKKTQIVPMTQVLFEGMQLPAPADYHAYLESVYGDYMTPTGDKDGLRHSIHNSSLTKKVAEQILSR